MVRETRKQSSRYLLSYLIKKALFFVFAVLTTHAIYANPVGGDVTAGTATISQTPGNTQVIQTSDKAIINWQSFNIAAGEKTNFQQPSSSSVTLNRINPEQGASQIFGSLTSNGRIILVNQAGIYFGPSAYVNVGGIIASTADITDQNFLAGKYIFDQASHYNGTIINQGTIIAANHGLVALVGSNVSNEGYINAHLGDVVLASGEKFTIDLTGDGLVNFTVDQAASSSGVDYNKQVMKNGVSNSGKVVAEGGRVMMSANEAQGVVDHAINMTGIVEAHSVSEHNGEIILDSTASGTVRVAGKLDASSQVRSGVSGGTVKVLGENIQINSPSEIDVSGDTGGGTILIGGNFHGAGPEHNALYTTIDAGANLIANALTNGKGGNIAVWSDLATEFHGEAIAQGGTISGDGGYIETSGHYLNTAGAQISTFAPNGTTGTWLLDPADLTICAACTTTATVGTNTYSNNATNSNLLVSDLTTALASNNITVQTTNTGSGGNGDILINTNITYNSSFNLSLSAYRSITASSSNSITNSGSGSVSLRADNTGTGTGTVSFGTGNVTATTGGVTVYYNPTTFGTPDTIYTGGTTPVAYMLVDTLGSSGDTSTRSLASISNTSTMWNKNFALAGNIDASATSGWNSGAGFIPIGNASTAFTGNFDGNNFAISSLTINRPSTQYVGFFGQATLGSNSIQNLGLTSASIQGAGSAVSNLSYALGGVVGIFNSGTINNVYLTGSVSQTGAVCTVGCGVGGIVGQMLSGTIEFTHNAASVNGTGSGAGGIVGYQKFGTIQTSFNTGSIVSNDGVVGGIVAYQDNNSLVTNSYNTGSVTASNAGAGNVGGVVGFLGSSATVSDSFSAGYVTGGSGSINVGGLVGQNNLNSGTVTNSYYDTQVSGGGSGTGETTATLQSALPTGFSGSTWGIISGQSYPYLLSFYSSTPSAVSGIAIGLSTANNKLQLAVGGTQLSNSQLTQGIAYAGANGYYYFLEPSGTIASGNDLLVYLSGASIKGNAVGIAGSGGSLSNLKINAANNIDVGTTSDSNAYNNSILSTALGSLNSTDILYSMSGNNLTLGNATNTTAKLNVGSSNVTYTINGGIATTSGGTSTLNFAGPTVINNSGNTITTSGAQTYSGAMTLSSDASFVGINLTYAGISGNGYGLTINTSGTSAINGLFSGVGSALTKAGPGTLTLNSANTFSGTVTVNAGTLKQGTTNAIGSSTGLNMADVLAAAFDLNGYDSSIYYLSGGGSNGGNILMGNNVLTLGAYDKTYNGSISGSGTFSMSTSTQDNSGVWHNGSGTLTLGGSSTMSGQSNITNASVTNANAFGTSLVVVGNGGALDINGVTLSNNINFNDGGNVLTGTGNAGLSHALALPNALTIGGTGTLTLSGVLSSVNGFTKSGTGTLVLSAANTFNGAVTVNSGTLSLANVNALGSTSGVTINSGATLDINNVSLGTIPVTLNSGSSLSGTGTATLANNITLPTSFTVGGPGSLTLSGILSGSNGVTLSGSGTVIFSGANTYTGATSINAGTLSLANVNATSNITLGIGTTLDINNVSLSGVPLTLNSGTTLTGTGVASLGSDLVLPSSFTVGGAGSLTLSGVLSGANGITKTGTGTLVLSGANTYDGTTTISAGTLRVTNATSLGSTVGGTSITSGAVLEVNNTNIGAEALTINGSGISLSGALIGVGTSSYAGNITMGSSSSVASSGDLTLSGVISGISTNILSKRGTGNVTLSGANTYSGLTTVLTGTLTAANSNALGSTSAGTTIASGATLNINNVSIGNEPITLIGALTGSGTASLAGNVTISSTGNREVGGTGTLTLSGVISGATRPLTKTGTGTVILSGVNTYTGTTTINAGTLKINADSGLGGAPGSATPGSIVFGGGTLETTGTFTLNANRGISLSTGGGTISTDPATTLTYNGIIAGAINLTKAGSGTLILGGANTNTGSTTINAGTLSISADANLGTAPGSATAGSLVFGGGSLETSNTFTLNANRGIAFNSDGTIITDPATTLTYNGIMAGSNGLIKAGNGILKLGGTNTYDGSTTLNAGALTIATDLALGAIPVSAKAGSLIFNGGTLENTQTFTLNTNRGIRLDVGGGTFFTDPDTVLTYDGVIAGQGGLIKAGAGVLELGGVNTYTGSTIVQAGSLHQFTPTVAPQILRLNAIIPSNTTANLKVNIINYLTTIKSITGAVPSGGNALLGNINQLTIDNIAKSYTDIISIGNLVRQGSWSMPLLSDISIIKPTVFVPGISNYGFIATNHIGPELNPVGYSNQEFVLNMRTNDVRNLNESLTISDLHYDNHYSVVKMVQDNIDSSGLSVKLDNSTSGKRMVEGLGEVKMTANEFYLGGIQ